MERQVASPVVEKESGYFMTCPINQYLAEKSKFRELYPTAIVIKEIETLGMGMFEVPDPQLIGKTKQQMVPVIYFFIQFKHMEIPTQEKPSIQIASH